MVGGQFLVIERGFALANIRLFLHSIVKAILQFLQKILLNKASVGVIEPPYSYCGSVWTPIQPVWECLHPHTASVGVFEWTFPYSQCGCVWTPIQLLWECLNPHTASVAVAEPPCSQCGSSCTPIQLVWKWLYPHTATVGVAEPIQLQYKLWPTYPLFAFSRILLPESRCG